MTELVQWRYGVGEDADDARIGCGAGSAAIEKKYDRKTMAVFSLIMIYALLLVASIFVSVSTVALAPEDGVSR